MPNNAPKKKKNNGSRKSRRSRKSNNKTPSLSTPVTTYNDMANRLLRSKNSKSNKRCPTGNLLSPYIHCRTNPFCATNSAGIPDGSSVRRVVFDHRSRSVVQCNGTGLLDIQFIPAIPCGALYRSASTSTTPQWIVDGRNVIDPNIVAANPQATAGGSIGWLQGNFYPEYNALQLQDPSSNNAATTPIPSSRARVVSMGWKISYIGQPMQASGYYYATRTPIDLVGNCQLNADPTLVYVNAAVLAQSTYAVDSVYVQMINATEPAAAATQAQTSDRIDVGCSGVLRANAQPEYKVVPKQNWLAVPQTASNLPNMYGYINSVSGAAYGSLRFWDDRFDPTTVRVQGMTSGTSLLVETVICVEYEVDANSILSRIAEPSAPARPLEVNAVEKVLSTMPISEKLVDIERPYEAAKNVIGKAVKLARLAPGPVGVAAGAVDSLIDLFGEL